MACGQVQALQKIDVESVAEIGEVRFPAVGSVVIDLQLNIVFVVDGLLPAAHNIAAGKQRVGIDDLRIRGSVAGILLALARSFVVDIALPV